MNSHSLFISIQLNSFLVCILIHVLYQNWFSRGQLYLFSSERGNLKKMEAEGTRTDKWGNSFLSFSLSSLSGGKHLHQESAAAFTPCPHLLLPLQCSTMLIFYTFFINQLLLFLLCPFCFLCTKSIYYIFCAMPDTSIFSLEY